MRTQNLNGYVEAIDQYENKSEHNQPIHSFIPTPQPINPREPTAITRVKKALGNQLGNPNISNFQQQLYTRANSLGYLHEKAHDTTNSLDATQHTVTYRQTAPLEIPKSAPRSMQSEYVNSEVRNLSILS